MGGVGTERGNNGEDLDRPDSSGVMCGNLLKKAHWAQTEVPEPGPGGFLADNKQSHMREVVWTRASGKGKAGMNSSHVPSGD